MKVLVIEDSEDDCMFYSRCLHASADVKYDVIEAEDGDAGLAKLAEETPDCILLDYSLPGLNGIEVLKSIRLMYNFVPVVMLTGQGNEEIAVKAIQEGAQNYITKSNITSESLQRVILNAVANCALQKRVDDQREALEIFTRALAHDLKEPVRTIRAYLDVMSVREGFSDKGKVYFNYIQNAAERMNRLIDTVFYYIRLDGAPEPISEEICDMNEVIRETKENIVYLVKDHNAVITHDPLPQVQANSMHMMQMMQNLITNSIRHSESQPIIHIGVSEEPEQWRFSVTDNGPGIRPEYTSQIFQAFKRLNSGHKEQGLGLGLAISKRIVESYGGKIWYEPASKGGAVFLFTMPKLVTHSNAKSSTANKKVSESIARIANVLLVEDNEADIELAKTLLLDNKNPQCNLLIAHNGVEALQMLNVGKKIDLVLLDINMPGMDGFEVLKKMQDSELLQHIPVIMCTTSSYDKDIDKAKSLGAVGYMSKPAEISKLQKIVNKTSNIALHEHNDGYVILRTTG